MGQQIELELVRRDHKADRGQRHAGFLRVQPLGTYRAGTI
jgi:hypothetical protein